MYKLLAEDDEPLPRPGIKPKVKERPIVDRSMVCAGVGLKNGPRDGFTVIGEVGLNGVVGAIVFGAGVAMIAGKLRVTADRLVAQVGAGEGCCCCAVTIIATRSAPRKLMAMSMSKAPLMRVYLQDAVICTDTGLDVIIGNNIRYYNSSLQLQYINLIQ